jgi:hypothetical protein
LRAAFSGALPATKSRNSFMGSAPRLGYSDKFDHIDPPLAALIFGDEGLRPAEFLRQSLLTEAGGMSHCDKGGNKSGIFRRFERFLHAPPEP